MKKTMRKMMKKAEATFETIEAYGCTCSTCGCMTVCNCDSPNNRYKINASITPDAANRKKHVGATSVYAM